MDKVRYTDLSFTTRLRVFGVYVKNAVIVVLFRLICLIPVGWQFLADRLYKVAHFEGTDVDLRDFVESSSTYVAWQFMSRSDTLDLLKQVSLNGKMCDVPLAHLDGKFCKLSDFVKKRRPLVINFGSCT